MRWLNDRYRLDAPVGRGGMAVVWRGYDAVLRRVVAVKMLPDLADDDGAHERLRAEALAAAQLSHPCIASVYDFGEAPAGWRRRAPFLIMEYVDGHTLAARLASGPLPWREAVRVCADIADALADAHASGLVHRDIKPGNVILSGSTVKVVDFGIATPSGGSQYEPGGAILGTQAYMAPEQAADTPALPASDIYALGLVLRDCLTGERPRPATGPFSPGRAEPAPALPPDVPAPVVALIGACLAETPGTRPTGSDAATVLRRAAGRPQPGTMRTPAPTPEPPTVPAGPTEPARSARHRWLPLRPRSHRPGSRRASAPQMALVAVAAAVLTVPLALLPAIAPGDSASGDAGPSAAPPRPGPPRGATGDCVAAFSARYRSNGSFTGVLDLTWTGSRSLVPWSVEFALPAGHRLVGADPGRLVEDHGTVLITSNQRLTPGRTVSVALQGTAADRGGAPHGFVLDGHACTRSTSDVQATETVPGPTRTVRVPPGTARQSDTPTSGPPPTTAPPSTTPSTSPSDPEPSTSVPSDPDPSVTWPSDPAGPASPTGSQQPGTASGTGEPPASGAASPPRSPRSGV